MNRNNALKKLVLAALFVALDLLFTRVFCIYLMGGAERVSLQTLASAVCGWALGPWWGAPVWLPPPICSARPARLLGLSFFPGFTLTAALRGLTYGLLLHKKPVTFPRCLAANAAVSILWGLLLNAVWLSLHGQELLGVDGCQGPLKCLLIPLYAYLIYLTLKGLQKAGLEKHL